MDPESLIGFLLERHGGDKERMSQLLAEFESSKRELFDFLTASGFGERDEILRFIASEQGRDFVDLDRVSMPPALLSSVDPEIARIFECLPIEVSEESLKICIADPFDVGAVRELTAIVGKPVQVAIADPRQIRERLSDFEERGESGANTGVVSASLGHSAERAKDREHGRQVRLSSLLVAALGALAVSAAAATALFLSQSNRIEQWKELVAQQESLLRQSEAVRKGAEVALLQMESDLETLEGLLVKKEVDAIRVDDLEKDLRQLRGKVESLGKILTKVEAPATDGESTPSGQGTNP